MRRRVLALVSILFLAGCIPEKIAWSPDGTQAIVVSNNGVFTFDDRGTLTKRHDKSPTHMLTPAVWSHDSSSLIYVERETFAEWEPLEKALPKEMAERIKKAGTALVERVPLFKDDWRNLRWGAGLTQAEGRAAWIYAREHGGDDFRSAIEPHRSLINGLRSEVFRLVRQNLQSSEKTTFAVVLDQIGVIRPSPDGKHLALVMPGNTGWQENEFPRSLGESSSQPCLNLVSIHSPGIIRTISNEAAVWPAWSQDSRYIYFVQGSPNLTVGSSDFSLGWLSRTDVTAEVPSVERIVQQAFHPIAKLAVTSSGRIICPAVILSLPTRPNQKPNVGLFEIDPHRSVEPIRIVLAETSEELKTALTLGCFAVSPDGTKLAVTLPDERTGIVSMETGQINWLLTVTPSPNNPFQERDTGSLASPAWRNNDEVCFVAPRGSTFATEKRREVVLWSPSRTMVLSTQWPNAEMTGLLQ